MPSVAHWSLDVAADSQEELQDWVKKIREVAQTADARVRTATAWKVVLGPGRAECGPVRERRRPFPLEETAAAGF